MEVFTVILGLAMLYSWGHLVYLNVMKLKDLTDYQTAVTVFAWFTLVLYIIGTLMN